MQQLPKVGFLIFKNKRQLEICALVYARVFFPFPEKCLQKYSCTTLATSFKSYGPHMTSRTRHFCLFFFFLWNSFVYGKRCSKRIPQGRVGGPMSKMRSQRWHAPWPSPRRRCSVACAYFSESFSVKNYCAHAFGLLGKPTGQVSFNAIRY